MEEKDIEIKGSIVKGIKIDLFKANLVLIKASKGYIMCGYLNMETADKLNDAACLVSGVSTIDEVLNTNIKEASREAKKLGIDKGMPVRKALEKLL